MLHLQKLLLINIIFSVILIKPAFSQDLTPYQENKIYGVHVQAGETFKEFPPDNALGTHVQAGEVVKEFSEDDAASSVHVQAGEILKQFPENNALGTHVQAGEVLKEFPRMI